MLSLGYDLETSLKVTTQHTCLALHSRRMTKGIQKELNMKMWSFQRLIVISLNSIMTQTLAHVIDLDG
ncbi:ORF177 [White spot syndrome virus]|uniref:ORF177 n=1 Tax=White spot syndrome virus TaxID=342409 RepID=A0A2D3I6M3_9VIRU|nr:ORF177 [White spot syndrome virus]